MTGTVALALSEGVPIFELAAPCAIFGPAMSDADSDWYTLQVCSPPGARVDNWFTAATPFTYDDLVVADTVVVPACHDSALEPPADLVEAVRAAAARGARVASICTGAFVLAAAGLLDGRRAATHWRHADTLAQRYREIHVDSASLYIDEGDVLTSAGKTAGLDLCLHLVRKDHGATVANQVARRLVAAPHREGHQRQYADPFPGPAVTDSLGETMAWVLEHLDQPLTVEQVARQARVSPRTLHRHFVNRTGSKPLDWLNTQRLRRAQQLLETTDLPIERVATDCGFGTAHALRRHFRDTLQTTPDAYRRTFKPDQVGI
ncbi:helix-turn-helix domain-containing protein [Amycolatopsis acidicola]|uniref:Helix-turn-helix domain-containing protein n=1 Tax=Amycolatopsis acidicola TaxID=2596893 RepID=A0A5N0UVF1_9PSEU|nr:helix-turn-helix domain-containing protein [Amycolatopsis acidicola]KAA9155794.1 helix-turn-helix domain-containing protein [Amycolatopsis acidicola]